MEAESDPLAALVDAGAAALALALDAERRAAVIVNLRRLAAFAANVGSVELGERVGPEPE